MESKPVSAMGRAIERLKVKKYLAAIKPYKCSECNDVFTTRSQLNGHLAFVHEGKKTYNCNICGKIFVSEKSANGNIWPNKCNVCDKHFFTKYQMHEHIAAFHEGVKPYKCLQCDASFSQSNTLKKHTKGQLISKCLFGVPTSPKKWTKTIRLEVP